MTALRSLALALALLLPVPALAQGLGCPGIAQPCAATTPAPTEDTVYVYPVVAQSSPGGLGSLAMSAVETVRFLMDDHATYSGPGWTLIEARSDGAREIPATASDLDSLATAVSWKGDGSGLAAGDWVVLRSAASVEAAGRFMGYFEIGANDTWNYWLFPNDDFTAQGAGNQSPPTTGDGLPASPYVVGNGASLAAITTYTGAGDLHIAATAAGMSWIRDDGSSNIDWMYLGHAPAVSGTVGGAADDARPWVVLGNGQANVYASVGGGGAYWCRTDYAAAAVVCGTKGDTANGATYFQATATTQPTANRWQMLELPLVFLDTGDTQMLAPNKRLAVGISQLVDGGANPYRTTISSDGYTTGDPDWACWSTAAAYGPVCLRSDGVTAWP